MLDSPTPRLKNTDGEDLLITRVQFEVADKVGLETALDGGYELRREEEGKAVEDTQRLIGECRGER